jgi:hypothetical protein
MFTFIAFRCSRRLTGGTQSGRRQIDHPNATGIELAAVVRMHIGAGGIKGDLDAIGLQMGQQAIDAFGRRFQAQFACTLQAFGLFVDSHHPGRLQHRAALNLVNKISADVSRADDGALDFFHVLTRPEV